MLQLVLSRSGFCSTDRFHGKGLIRVFLLWSKAGKFKICNQDSEKKCENCHSSHWNYLQKLKRLKFFPKFQKWIDGWRKRTFFKCKLPEVHFTIRNRVPYNKLLTNRACSGRTGEYWPEVVKVRTERSEVRTKTTEGQYTPVRPSRSVSKRLLFFLLLIARGRVWASFNSILAPLFSIVFFPLRHPWVWF